MAQTISGTFTGTGSSAGIIKGVNPVDISLIGVGANTVTIDRMVPDGTGTTWGVVKTYTANAEDAVTNGTDKGTYRVTCSVYASGTISYNLFTSDG